MSDEKRPPIFTGPPVVQDMPHPKVTISDEPPEPPPPPDSGRCVCNTCPTCGKPR